MNSLDAAPTFSSKKSAKSINCCIYFNAALWGPKMEAGDSLFLTIWGINHPETTCCDVNKLHFYCGQNDMKLRNSRWDFFELQLQIADARKKLCIVFPRVNTKILTCDWLKMAKYFKWLWVEVHILMVSPFLFKKHSLYWCNALTCKTCFLSYITWLKVILIIHYSLFTMF